MKLQSKVAMITGASQGIGREYALRYAREGAAVVIADIREEAARQVEAEITGAGGKAMALRADVTDQEQMNQVAKKAAERFGPVDVLLNNAATYFDYEATNQSLEYGRKVMDINVFGIVIAARSVFPFMKANRRGSIINIASVAAWPQNTPYLAELDTVPIEFYSLSKSAVTFLTRWMAQSLGQYNIRVNGIAPGVVLTDATLKLMPEDMIAYFRNQTALRRDLQPTDLAGTAVFLASDDSALMTGQTLVVDAGRIMLT
ncbi:MAG TPA: SDR family oxidoreductase [Candidatus Binataceae bacterium]|jgi:3-oxoacyl-[acyl-carrier protein] reductase|nr:SDR family oxidoreductase [Candidatus Binataceae bacterium]